MMSVLNYPPTDGGGASYPTELITGFAISSAADADHDITIEDGAWYDAVRGYSFTGPMTKRADATWTEGDTGGLMDSASGAISANESIVVYSIYETADASNVDFLGTDQGSALVLPTGWSEGRRIGSFMTDASGNFYPFTSYQSGGLRRTMFSEDIPEAYDTGVVNSLPADPTVSGFSPVGVLCSPVVQVYIIDSGNTYNFINVEVSKNTLGYQSSIGRTINTVGYSIPPVTDGTLDFEFSESGNGDFRILIYPKGYEEYLND